MKIKIFLGISLLLNILLVTLLLIAIFTNYADLMMVRKSFPTVCKEIQKYEEKYPDVERTKESDAIKILCGVDNKGIF